MTVKKLINFEEAHTISLLQIAPVIHEWTYDAMCHDLLNMDGNKYVQEVSMLSFIFFPSTRQGL